ncbi:hypothetical protein RJT34_19237 [Clitoria ternatea]|uniref:Peptidase C1A papain C-terminal domain-containing protein n=1 Tax=Clitoria ternatea TaxID=43366 RepID=A0AAN9IQY6_CLITE
MEVFHSISKMASTLLLPLTTFFLALSVSYLQIAGAETHEELTTLRLNSHILQESIVRHINENIEAGWKAALNPRFSNYTVEQFKRLLGVKPTLKKELRSTPVVTHPKSLKLPKNFDARTAWSQCSTIGRILGVLTLLLVVDIDTNSLIKDQGHCGSCWAFAPTEALSDRFCTHFDVNVSLSVNDVLACCGHECGEGCNGGLEVWAWQYFASHGVVTEECDPYFDQIGCTHPGCVIGDTPQCVKKCLSGNRDWKTSKHYSVNAYYVSPDPHDIMAEVYKNGPVAVGFDVYADFAYYKSGVYKHVTGPVLGGHAAKLIGWGTTDDGEDYWLLANQWNREWGDDGYFKIRRGANECGIEDGVTGGLPSTKNVVKEVTDMDADTDLSF